MAVGIQGYGDGRVSQKLLNHLRVDSFGEEQSSAGVSEVVKAHVGKTCLFKQTSPESIYEMGAIHRFARTIEEAPQGIRNLALAMVPQGVYGHLRQPDGTVASLSLGRVHLALPDCAFDPHCFCIKIHAVPPKCQ